MSRKVVAMIWVGAILLFAVVGAFLLLKKNTFSTYDSSYTWSVDYDQNTQKDVLVRGRNVKSIHKDINKLVVAFNLARESEGSCGAQEETTKLELPRLRLERVAAGVAYVEVVNAECLSQRMGTSGAENFLAAATFTLTECPGVTTVNFNFPEGDHAAPGSYSRKTFRDYVIASDRK